MAKKPLRTERALLKAKHYFKKNYIPAIACIAILIGLALFALNLNQKNPYEITENDIFALKDFNAKDVSVFGVKLGDNAGKVIEEIGEADNIRGFEDIENWEYSEKIGLPKGFYGLLIQVQQGIVVRITFKIPFNEHLQGSTKIDMTKDEIYQRFGNPDESGYVQYESNTGRAFRLMNYKSKNLEFIVLGNEQNGFSFYL